MKSLTASILFILMTRLLIAQDVLSNYSNSSFQYIGKIEYNPIFIRWNGTADKKYNYSANIDNNEIKSFTKVENKIVGQRCIFVSELLEAYIIDNSDLLINKNSNIYNGKKIKPYQYGAFQYLSEQDRVFVFIDENPHTRIAEIIFHKDLTLEAKPLPLLGRALSLTNEYLYFSYDFNCGAYSITNDNIYRVRFDDWYNPELVLNNVESKEWFHIKGTDIIQAYINLDQYLEGYRDKEVLYSANERKFQITEKKSTNKVLEMKGEVYYEIQGKDKISFEKFEMPDSFPYTEEKRTPCMGDEFLVYNLPLSQKSFEGSFINDHLLYEGCTTKCSFP